MPQMDLMGFLCREILLTVE